MDTTHVCQTQTNGHTCNYHDNMRLRWGVAQESKIPDRAGLVEKAIE